MQVVWKYRETSLETQKGNKTYTFELYVRLLILKTKSDLSAYQNYMSNLGHMRGSFWPFAGPKKSFSQLFNFFFEILSRCLRIVFELRDQCVIKNAHILSQWDSRGRGGSQKLSLSQIDRKWARVLHIFFTIDVSKKYVAEVLCAFTAS